MDTSSDFQNQLMLLKKWLQSLIGQLLLEIKIKKDTADLMLTLTNNLQVEVFISSRGYESYNIHVGKINYIGMGMGDIAIFNSGTWICYP